MLLKIVGKIYIFKCIVFFFCIKINFKVIQEVNNIFLIICLSHRILLAKYLLVLNSGENILKPAKTPINQTKFHAGRAQICIPSINGSCIKERKGIHIHSSRIPAFHIFNSIKPLACVWLFRHFLFI